MNIGDFMTTAQKQFIYELYQFLRDYIDADTLADYRVKYSHGYDHKPFSYGFLNEAFYWSPTPEGHEYWRAIAEKQPHHLISSRGIDLTFLQVLEGILDLYQENESKPYEYW